MKPLDKGATFSRDSLADKGENASLWDWAKDRVEKRDKSEQHRDRILQVVQNWGSYVREPIEAQSLKNVRLETTMPVGEVCALFNCFSLSRVCQSNYRLFTGRLHIREDSPHPHPETSTRTKSTSISTARPLLQFLISTGPIREGQLLQLSRNNATFDHVDVATPHGWLD